MKTKIWSAVAICFFLGATASAEAATFTSGSTGADGALAPTANTTLTVPASGVFNFTTVTIPASITVTFKKNAANTPVVILAMGDVTIAGVVRVNGADGAGQAPGEGGVAVPQAGADSLAPG